MLKPSMERAAIELALGNQVNQVGKLLNKHRSTIARWKRDAEFQIVLATAKNELRERILYQAASNPIK